mgnify:CR=1 FL=1
MQILNIPYQSFCWVIGTTSFRTAKLNLKIEEQLILLSEFHEKYLHKFDTWAWNKESQALYYDFMKKNGFIYGEAKRKDKDAREKTSGLVDIGLINDDRTLTEAGNELLNIARQGDFREDNYFNIDKDSYVYLKQLLKTSIKVGAFTVRPYLVLAKVLTELEYLTYDEFTYILPLTVDNKSTRSIINRIRDYRMGKATLEDIIYEDLMDMENYRLAYKTFMSNRLSEELICLVGMNRKSRNYDRPYCNLLVELIRVFHHGEEERAYDLFLAAKKISHKPGMLWRNVIFTTSVAGNIRKNGIKTVREDCIFKKTKSEREIKTTFYKYMHVFKAMATLADYFDLNRRYFNLTDTLIFEDNIVKFDLIPRYFFKECIEKVYKEGFTENVYLKDSVPTEQISSHLIFNEKIIYSKISKDLGIIIKTPEQATTFIRDERYRRFNRLIDSKFSDKVLLELLSCFETRDDARIEELVTDEANIPTIFEYITGIIWYKVSERQGNILEYMKLSLEPNLLPKAHATGGSADIIYEYSACRDFPKHSLLIEATLSEGTSQRRMEMEPVSRHLGEFLLKSNNPFDYTLFISTYLHKNVMADFRGRKYMQYYGNGDEIVDGMKIISLDTGALKIIINKNIKYRYLYKVFDKYYESDEPSLFEWQDNLIKEATQTYIDFETEF